MVQQTAPQVHLSPMAGKPATKEMLVDVAKSRARILRAQTGCERSEPDGQLRHQRASRHAADGHVHGSAHSGDHAGDLRLPARAREWTARCSWGKIRTRLSGPAQTTALEVLAANGVETVIQRDDGFTPTPVISHAILAYNRGRRDHLADGIVITPSHNPPRGWRLQIQPDERRSG